MSIFFSDNFESGDLSKSENGFNWGSSTRVTVSSSRSNGGSYSLQFTYPATALNQGSLAEQRFNLGTNYPDLWCRYDMFIPTNYYHRDNTTTSSNNKALLMVWSGVYSSPDTITGQMASVQTWPSSGTPGNSSASLKIKTPRQSDGTYLDQHYSGLFTEHVFKTTEQGEWVTYIIHYKYASSADNDGIGQVWKIQGGVQRQILDKTDGNWYYPSQVGFDQGYLLGASNSGFASETVFYIDNIVFSTTSLLDGALPVVAEPKAPLNIQ